MTRSFRAAFAILLVLLWPLTGFAQDAAELEPQAETAETQTPAAGPLPDDEGWERLAARAEEMAKRGDASRFALNRLRAELVIWRDEFLSRSGKNAGRIATVDAQLAALGPVPESGEEAAAIAARREALQDQRQDLIAPRLLSEEAYARANGLIGEFDAQIRLDQTNTLAERGPSPLNPTHLGTAAEAIWNVIRVIGVESAAGVEQEATAGRLVGNAPRAFLYVILALGLLGLARRWITDWRARLSKREGRLVPLWLFVVSLAQILVPIIGLFALREGLETLDVFGLRGSAVVDRIPLAGFTVVFAWWLSRHLFPIGETSGYLGYDQQTRASGRRYSVGLAWVLGIGSLFDAALRTMDLSDGTRAAIEWPVLVLIGLLLWRLGRVIKRKPEEVEGVTTSQGRMRGLLGRVCTILAITGPAVAAFGFVTAGRALLIPSVMSLALIGLVLVLQRIVHDLSTPKDTDNNDKGVFALLPVLISFVLYVASLPLFALIWGARVDDLTEIWARFREGFAIGESRISPTDFLTFAMVFALGYLLTRFIQGTLRKSVLPRTRLDLGGQNAIVAGFGYVGIILAAIIAITSAGIDLSNLAIVAGALSVGIGFGLQNIVSNFVSGIILLIERPVSEGDWIEVGGQMGYVRAISVRSTRIETFDRTDVIIPNADLVSGQVTNWTRGNLVGRVIVPVGVAYGSDAEKVTNILRGIAEAHPLVLMTPPPSVLFQGFGADSLDFEIRAILRDVNYVLATKSEMNHEIAKQFAEAGIEIPFAQRDIWLRNPEVLKDKDV